MTIRVSPAKPKWLVPAALIMLSTVPVVAGSIRVAELTGGAEITTDNARFFAMLVHIFSASLYCVMGAFQFVPGRRRRWHRPAGRLIVPCGLAAALSGMWMTVFLTRPAGDLVSVLRLLFGTAMVLSIVLGFVAIRRRDILGHQPRCDRTHHFANQGESMKAIAQDRYGSPDALSFRVVDKPVAADDEVLVQVHAAAVNAYDWHVMRGDPYLARLAFPAAFGLGGPKNKIRGRDFAGRVETVGKNVTRFRAGDEVYGDLGHANGAFAEYVSVTHDWVEPKPANLTFEQAAAVPLAGNTALMGLRDVARVQPGQRVLINGASGGVGTFAVQIAKAFGAEVTGVCSTRNVDLVRSIGADHVIDYTHSDFSQNGPFDVVFDLVGNRSLTSYRHALTPNGTLVLSGGGNSHGGSVVGPMGLLIKSQLLSPFVRRRLLKLTEVPSGQNLAILRDLIESGDVTPVIDRTYPLSETAEAIRYLEVEHARGKVVITI